MSRTRIDITSGKKAHEVVWELEANHLLRQGVMPLFIRLEDHYKPVGTAFVFGNLGIFGTAEHCIAEALKFHTGRPVPRDGSGHFDLRGVGLSVLHQHQEDDGRTKMRFVDVEFANTAPPTDVVLGALEYAPDVEYLRFRLSPGVPRIGTTVYAIGFVDTQCPPGGISGEAVRAGRFDWNSYSHRLIVSQGEVEKVFLHSCGHVKGACFLATYSAQHGQSVSHDT